MDFSKDLSEKLRRKTGTDVTVTNVTENVYLLSPYDRYLDDDLLLELLEALNGCPLETPTAAVAATKAQAELLRKRFYAAEALRVLAPGEPVPEEVRTLFVLPGARLPQTGKGNRRFFMFEKRNGIGQREVGTMGLSEKEKSERIKLRLDKHRRLVRESRMPGSVIEDVTAPAKEGRYAIEGLEEGLPALKTAAAFMGPSFKAESSGAIEDLDLIGLDAFLKSPKLADLYAFYVVLGGYLEGKKSLKRAYGQASDFYRELEAKAADKKARERMFPVTAESFEDVILLCAGTKQEKEEVKELLETLRNKTDPADEKIQALDDEALREFVKERLVETVLADPGRFPTLIRFEDLYERFMEQLISSREFLRNK